MSPKSVKQTLFTPAMVANLIVALLAAGGGGAVTGRMASSDAQSVMAYRVEQLEQQVKVEQNARALAEAKAAEFDKRLTVFEGQLNRFDKILDRLDRHK